MSKTTIKNYGNLRIITIEDRDIGEFSYGDISAFSYGDIIIRYHDRNLDILAYTLRHKRTHKHFIKALSYIYGDIKESLLIPHRIALDYQAIKQLVLENIGNGIVKTDKKLKALCDTLGLVYYGNADGRWVRLRA